jgi:hypothetical protein
MQKKMPLHTFSHVAKTDVVVTKQAGVTLDSLSKGSILNL